MPVPIQFAPYNVKSKPHNRHQDVSIKRSPPFYDAAFQAQMRPDAYRNLRFCKTSSNHCY